MDNEVIKCDENNYSTSQQVHHFGHVPTQLFSIPHPSKLLSTSKLMENGEDSIFHNQVQYQLKVRKSFRLFTVARKYNSKYLVTSKYACGLNRRFTLEMV